MEITKDQMKMQIHHIGGIKDCGPAEQLTMLKEDAKWTFYDADEESLKQTSIEGKEYRLIPKAIGGIDGDDNEFYVLKSPSASSFLRPAEEAKDYLIQGTEETWGEHTEVQKIITMPMTRIDTMVENKEIGKIDVLSIDVQGGELDVITGAANNLKNVLAVICEVEFRRLYKDQDLFFDIHKWLSEEDFELWAVYNLQYFNKHPYPKPIRGFGVITVGEALFVRNPEPLLKEMTEENIEKLVKIALISLCYDQRDVAYYIIHEMELKGFSLDILEQTYSITELNKAYKVAKSILWRK
jgi:FkbM family methyltransferase